MFRSSLGLLALITGCSGGDADTSTPANSDAAAPTEGCATFSGEADLYVGFECPLADADGSRAHPFGRLADALTAAGDRTTIRLSGGSFEGATHAARTLRLIGEGDETHVTSPLVIEGVARLDLADVRFDGLEGAAIEVRSGARLTARDVSIQGVRALAGGAPGVGVLATDGAGIILQDYVIEGCAGPGILVNDAVAELRGGTLSGNGAGIRIERGRDRSTIEDNTLTGNAQAGLALFSTDALVRGNHIVGTRADAQGFGDGLVAGELEGGFGPSHVQLEGHNEIRQSARVGVLFAAGATGVITGNVVDANTRAGIWAQGVTALEIGDNTLTANHSAGILLFGAQATLTANTVTDTRTGHFDEAGAQIDTADAIAVLAASDADIHDNTLTGAARLGIVVDAASARISGNVVSGSPHGIILQDLPAPEAVTVDVSDGVMRDPAERVAVPESALGL
jgi:hypothetical protein